MSSKHTEKLKAALRSGGPIPTVSSRAKLNSLVRSIAIDTGMGFAMLWSDIQESKPIICDLAESYLEAAERQGCIEELISYVRRTYHR